VNLERWCKALYPSSILGAASVRKYSGRDQLNEHKKLCGLFGYERVRWDLDDSDSLRIEAEWREMTVITRCLKSRVVSSRVRADGVFGRSSRFQE